MGFNVTDRKRKKSIPKHINHRSSLAQKDAVDGDLNLNESCSSEDKPKKKQSRMVEKIKTTAEELEFRKEKQKEVNDVEKYLKFFKCTKCQQSFKPLIDKSKTISEHPFLGVLMCEDCCDYYGDGAFSLDSDGEDKYCRWCGEGGTIFTCSDCICGFCSPCIKNQFGPDYLKKVQNDDNWQCFFCDPKPLWDKRFICTLAKDASLRKNQKQSSSIWTQMKINRESETKRSKKSKSKTANTQSSDSKYERKAGKRDTSNKEESPLKTLPSPLGKGKSRFSGEFWKTKITSSSSDEESDSFRTPKKKLKLFNTTRESTDRKSMLSDVETNSSDKLEKILKLSEYQLGFGVNWSTKTLKKLAKHKTGEELKEDCQKIKWFLSLLSGRLVELCNAVDSIENSLCRENGIKDSAVEYTTNDASCYGAIEQFLQFMGNQVKAFRAKSIPLNDIFESEIYEDSNVIGIKKKSKSNHSGDDRIDSPVIGGKISKRHGREEEESPENKAQREKESQEAGSDSSITIDYIQAKTDESEKEEEEGESGELGDMKRKEDMKEIIAILENA